MTKQHANSFHLTQIQLMQFSLKRNRSKRNHRMNATHVIDRPLHSENANQFEAVMHHGTQRTAMLNLDNPKIDIQIDYGAIESNKQVSASKCLT